MDALAASGSELTAAREQGFALKRDIAAMAARQVELAARIAHKAAHVEELHARLAQGRSAFDRARMRVLDSARARYTLSLQPKIKLLLSQNDARALSRNLAYYDYLIRTYQRDLQHSRTQVETLEQVEAALKLETNTLRRLRHETSMQMALLEGLRAEHAGLIAAIEQRMNEGGARVEQLRQDEQRLLALIEELAARPQPTVTATPFAELKGRLEWPAAGAIASLPGTAIREGGARWPGVFIDTADGTEVTAVAAGTVVFADWFRNLGQLVIVDHGGGYMSLYGNNAEIEREPGEEVAAGDVLAYVGDGSGELPRGLYFELRAGGEPLDPRTWCVARQQH